MLNGCYTFNELKEKYKWDTTEGGISAQIRYARNRGVEIEFAFKEGKSYFHILSDKSNIYDEWKIYPKNNRYEVSKNGFVRTSDTHKLVGAETQQGYIVVTDTTQQSNKYYRINRMVLETFSPIPNDNLFVADHINGIKTDNRLENLRWLTQRQNIEARDENFAKLNQNYQKLIEKYGYEGLNNLFLAILNEK